MKKIVENVTLDEERALYGSKGLIIRNVSFDGPADGESAVKECEDITAEHCFCNLRYPFWHVTGLTIVDTEMTEYCRAALWYSRHITVRNSKLHGIKALRECADAAIIGCDIVSPEFGWSTDGVKMEDCTAVSEYFMMRSNDLRFKNVRFKGKYSFQYIKRATFENCEFDTKDAFWHGEDIVVKDSVLKGEYFAWYSQNLTLINCTIIGTQPFCYCRELKLINCKMVDCDLAFERSEVEAEVVSRIDSVKNPYGGTIRAQDVGEIIRDDPAALGEVVITGK